MSFSDPLFVLAIVAMSMVGWVVTSWMRVKHGYPITDDWGNTIQPPARDDAALSALGTENKALKDHVAKLEDRLRVLERIATDPATRTAAEIESLRHN